MSWEPWFQVIESSPLIETKKEPTQEQVKEELVGLGETEVVDHHTDVVERVVI